MAKFQPGGIIGLMTDFGIEGDYSGLMHAAILGINSKIRVVDLCHSILPGDIETASFILSHDYRYFPGGTVFVAIVDPGVGSERKILAALVNNYIFLAPDNGLLHPILLESEHADVYLVENESYFLSDVSSTFHGRDIFAPVAAHLASGLDIRELGRRADTWNKTIEIGPELREDKIVGKVIFVDRFGNLITNIPSELLETHSITISKLCFWRVKTFSEGHPNEVVCLAGSKETVEIVSNGGNASQITGFEAGAVVEAFPV